MIESAYAPSQFSNYPYSPLNPAAGVQLVQNIASGVIWELISISFLFTADANVADRFISLNLEDTGADIFFKSLLPAAFVASGANQISFGAGYAHPSQGDAHTPTTGSWPVGLFMPGPYRLSIRIANIQAGDQISDVHGFFHQRLITRV